MQHESDFYVPLPEPENNNKHIKYIIAALAVLGSLYLSIDAQSIRLDYYNEKDTINGGRDGGDFGFYASWNPDEFNANLRPRYIPTSTEE